MNEQRIEELKNALRDVMELIVNRDQPLTDELKTMLAQVMEHVATRIQQLRQEEDIPSIPEPLPDMQEAMPSSNIDAYNYDYDTGKLLVRFLGDHPNREGSVYSYEGVPRYMYDLFRKGAVQAKTTGKNKWGSWWKGKSPSIGAAMSALIKNGGYSYQRLS